MTFTLDGQRYRLDFQRREYEQEVPVRAAKGQPAHLFTRRVRRETTAYLFQLNPDGTPAVELMRATARRYFRDPDNREEARLAALRQLTPFIAKVLRKPVWEAYIGRPRGTTAPKVRS